MPIERISAFIRTDISDEAGEVGPALTTVLKHTIDRIQALFDLSDVRPTPENRRFHEALHTLDRVVYSMIEERRRPAQPADDLLSMLIFARDEETGQGMSDRQLRVEVMTLFLAGHETTANALAWTWYLLSTQPEIERHLEMELATVAQRYWLELVPGHPIEPEPLVTLRSRDGLLMMLRRKEKRKTHA